MRLAPTVLAVLLVAVGCGTAASALSLDDSVQVPAKWAHDPPGWTPPNGEHEPVRYTKAYQAFFWRCVALRAADPKARCPWTCSGTPAATYGCSDGSDAADGMTRALYAHHPAARVRRFLARRAVSPAARRKMAPYFGAP